MDYRQIYSIKQRRKEQIKKLCPDIADKSGIYLFYRWKIEEQKWCMYIGQSQTSVWERCASHLDGYKKKNPSHIDNSLKTHGISTNKTSGWMLRVLCYCRPKECNELEQKYIESYRQGERNIVYNITIGSQGKGKVDFQERNHERLMRYKNGKAKGEKAVLDKIKVYFDKYLDYVIKGKPNKTKERKLKEFEELLEG
jgi:hypothetical protein